MQVRFDPEGFGFLVNDTARLVRAEVDRRTAQAGLGLTQGEGRTLTYAYRAGPVRQNVLAERLGVEAMTLSGTLDRLEAKGLIERRPDPADRRAKLVHLTEAASAIVAAVVEIGVELREEASRGIPAEEWKRFLATLKAVRTNLVALRDDASEEAAA